MSLPETYGRSGAVVSVEWDPVGAPGVFTNWCGSKKIGASLKNEITSEKVGDCADWSLPVETVKEYAGQDASFSFDGTFTRAQFSNTFGWWKNQEKKKVKITYPYNTNSGEISTLEATTLLTGLDWDEIGNLEGSKISESITLEVSGTITPTFVA